MAKLARNNVSMSGPCRPNLLTLMCQVDMSGTYQQHTQLRLWEDEPAAHAPATTVVINKQGKEIANCIYQVQNWLEDIALVPDMGFQINDDNNPAPKNVPVAR